MKKLFLIPGLLFLFVLNADANRQNKKDSQTQQTQQTQSDSLPEGFTQDRLNNLLDESGNRIFSDESSRLPEDAEGDAIQRTAFYGQVSGDNFGSSVSNAGDVNGDGYDDIIIGAFNFSGSRGRAYIYFGGASINIAPDVIMTGETNNNRFGWSVSTAGDVNGDGYSDVIVGASGYNSFTGRAYIFFGGGSMDNVPDVIMNGENVNDAFGISVSTAGDVNGDGYSDVIVGADQDQSITPGGKSYIFLGGSSMNNVADVVMTDEATVYFFGYSVSTAGDVNGDGYSDVIVGTGGYPGKANIYFGGANMNNVPDVIMTNQAAGNSFGSSVSTAGDVNGDGYSDVIVGARQSSSSKGSAFIFFGGANMNNVPDVTMTGEAAFNYFGTSVSTAGDVNGDGYSDVIVGADGVTATKGKAYVFFGGANMDNAADVVMTGEAYGGNIFGRSVSTAGDVNGDGYSEFIVGDPWFLNVGSAYLFDVSKDRELIPDITLNGEVYNNYFGASVSTAGDVNGDGFSDVIVGAYFFNSQTGRAYIFFGGPNMDYVADVEMTGGSVWDNLGFSVSTAGDVNGDGFSDVIVGAYGYNSNAGRAYIFFGGENMDTTADVIMTGEAQQIFFGVSVSTAGDVNGDGFSDVIVGAHSFPPAAGRSYIFFGGAGMNNVADVIMTGVAQNNYFGWSVSTAGDVNNDGYSDVIVGAYGNSTNKGIAYIFFGGGSMDNVADVTMTGEIINSNFGYSVSTAGDVNGDGFSDVIVGAWGYVSIFGRAYIFFGGASMDNVPDLIMTGEGPNNTFGASVSTAGDVNLDGYSDVIVGASGYSSNTGKGYVFFGGHGMDNIADLTMTGEAVGNAYGSTVSSAGDVNGDGYSDVIAGALGFNSNTGRAYIYKGSAIGAKPILIYVKDVPNDQGGMLNLKWARSSYDVFGNSLITDYVVYRSYPPSGGGFSWEESAIISATNQSFYTYIDNTPDDSSSDGNGTMFYQIKARTANSFVFWMSGILYGRSIDNISPPAVTTFNALGVSGNVRLTWDQNPAPDLYNYLLFRNASDSIDPYTEPVFATTTDSTYLDTSPLSGVYYYFIVAQDINNNYSPVAMTEAPNISLNLTMFIEGFYNSGSNVQVSDTIRVELRNQNSPFNVIDNTKAVVGTNGSVVLKFGNAPTGNYYLALRHRNSIETWSINPVSLTIGSSSNYDFSNSASQAYGDNMKQIDTSPTRYAIYGGDVNQDGIVDGADGLLIDNDAANFESGYLQTDLNGDEIIDGSDAVIADNNAANFVSAVTP